MYIRICLSYILGIYKPVRGFIELMPTSFSKLIHNHDLFVSFLQSKLSYKYINYDLLLDSVSILSVKDLISLKKVKTLDYFVRVNENVTPQVINRVFLKLLDYQKTILLGINPNIVNTKYSTTQAITFN